MVPMTMDTREWVAGRSVTITGWAFALELVMHRPAASRILRHKRVIASLDALSNLDVIV